MQEKQPEERVDTPGLKKFRRKNGRIDLYWCADEKRIAEGYLPKAIRIHADISDPLEIRRIAGLCQRYQAEMLQWASGITGRASAFPQGSVGWLCEQFEIHVDSPFREKRQATQIFYGRYLSRIKKDVGQKPLHTVTGLDIRRWHRNWRETSERGAYGCIQSLRRVVSFGVELDSAQAKRLSVILAEMRFENATRRKQRITHDQVRAFRAAAISQGEPAMALAVTLQFDLMMRQKDIIGEYVAVTDGRKAEGAIQINGRVWQWGLTWAHIDSAWQVTKPTSKSNGKEIAEHNLRLLPDSLEALQAAPLEHRIGPVVRNPATGLPYTTSHFSRKFRTIARLAGIPDDVWNMDSRAGGVTEAFNAGAEPVDVMNSATHTQMTTTMGYDRDRASKSDKVARLRVATRKPPK